MIRTLTIRERALVALAQLGTCVPLIILMGAIETYSHLTGGCVTPAWHTFPENLANLWRSIR